MKAIKISSPGVYIEETSEFGTSIIPISSAVPAFIGYTAQALNNGKSCLNIPIKISSFAEFKRIFCLPESPALQNPTKHYNPQYYLVAQNGQPNKGKFVCIDKKYYSILPDPGTIYYLFTSLQLYFQNGGEEAYIVSVGTFGKPSGNPVELGERIVNNNVLLSDLLAGIAVLGNEIEPTMYLLPEATLLAPGDYSTLIQAAFLQNENMNTAVTLVDIIGGDAPDPLEYTKDIERFRSATGSIGLNYGIAYYPFLGTSILQNNAIDYTNLMGGDLMQLGAILNEDTDPELARVLKDIRNGNELSISENNRALMNVSPTYQLVHKAVLELANIQPPSGAMAGIIASTDRNEGVWRAPANTAIAGASSLTIQLTDEQQANLNIDPISGKSVNAIRFFKGRGILVWGARTLDGNSNEWRYISVRRTLLFIENSCKMAMKSYVFEPNVSSTWSAVTTSISNFLNQLWKEGGLLGTTATQAYSVQCGLGSTMTGQDIAAGIMNVTIKVAVTHPAEFIVISLTQEMST